ncbi:MAG: helix-turn-helix transcriptional regulator [Ignavibacteria bacterium]|nr:helix-turn-helix transcriptional regulator [Ignavibacteria bacterium]
MKTKSNVDVNTFFKNILESIPDEVKQSVDLSMAIASQINSILKKKDLTQRDLANLLGKKESEISKWLSGNHNFTTNTIAKIQSVLGETIISVPIYSKKDIKFIPIQSYSVSFPAEKFKTDFIDPIFIGMDSPELNMIINCNTGSYATRPINK